MANLYANDFVYYNNVLWEGRNRAMGERKEESMREMYATNWKTFTAIEDGRRNFSPSLNDGHPGKSISAYACRTQMNEREHSLNLSSASSSSFASLDCEFRTFATIASAQLSFHFLLFASE